MALENMARAIECLAVRTKHKLKIIHCWAHDGLLESMDLGFSAVTEEEFTAAVVARIAALADDEVLPAVPAEKWMQFVEEPFLRAFAIRRDSIPRGQVLVVVRGQAKT
jgi:hypothetical protein